MNFKKDIVSYLENNPKTKSVFIHKDTGVHFFNQPTTHKMVTVKNGEKERQEKQFSADKNYVEYTREEVLEGGAVVSPYAKKKYKDLIAICVERQYPADEYEGKKGDDLRSYIESKDSAETE